MESYSRKKFIKINYTFLLLCFLLLIDVLNSISKSDFQTKIIKTIDFKNNINNENAGNNTNYFLFMNKTKKNNVKLNLKEQFRISTSSNSNKTLSEPTHKANFKNENFILDENYNSNEIPVHYISSYFPIEENYDFIDKESTAIPKGNEKIQTNHTFNNETNDKNSEEPIVFEIKIDYSKASNPVINKISSSFLKETNEV